MNIQCWFPLRLTGVISLLAVQGTLKRLLQHHISKTSILWHSAFIMVQLSHPHMTTGKVITLTTQTFVGKVISLLFNMLSRLVIAFLSGASIFKFHDCSYHLHWFWNPRKQSLFPLFLPTICHEVMGPDAMIWVFKPAFSCYSLTFYQEAL